MSQQVERLQALLERVQRNRVAHDGAPPRPVAAAAVPARPAPAPEPVTPQPATPARGKAAPTPLEIAFEGRAARPIDPPTQPIAFTPPAPAQRAVPAPAPFAAAKAAPAPAPGPVEGRVLVDSDIGQPTKAIAQVVSKQPPIAASSFGELLRRSLSLRPR